MEVNIIFGLIDQKEFAECRVSSVFFFDQPPQQRGWVALEGEKNALDKAGKATVVIKISLQTFLSRGQVVHFDPHCFSLA